MLRHTNHGEALAEMGFVDYGVATLLSPAAANPVIVPPPVMMEIEPVLERLGGATLWGVQVRELARIEAREFCERMFPLATEALNRLLAATNVAELAGVDDSELATGPPPLVEVHSEEQRARWRSVLGLSH